MIRQISNKQIHSTQICTVSIDIDSLTVQAGLPVTLTANVSPPGTYDINFKYGDVLLNPTPIPTDPSGVATLVLDTTDQSPGLYDITTEVVNPAPPPSAICISSPITVALTTTVCTDINITNPSPTTAYIGDIIPVSIVATVTESSVVELRDIDSGRRVGNCIIDPTIGNCTINADTTGATPGTYHIAAYIGYGLAQQCFSPTIDAILQLRPGNILVVSIPPGAKIYIDDIDTGLTSSALVPNITPYPDTHTVKLTLSGYNDYISTVSMGPGETTSVIALLEPTIPPTGFGNLNVTSVPDGVEFYLDTEEGGIAPTTLTDVPTGIRAYEAGLDGYTGAMGSIEIKDGQTSNLHIPLIPSSPDQGIVFIESIPMGAKIFIDDADTGAKTSFATLLSPELHTYKLEMPGYQSKSGTFTVVTGYNMPAIVSETLQPISSTGMAVMLIGAAAVGMMMLPKK